MKKSPGLVPGAFLINEYIMKICTVMEQEGITDPDSEEAKKTCLTCPSPLCEFEGGKIIAEFKRERRKQEFIELIKSGKSISDIAFAYGVCIRTVMRALK